MKHKTTPCGVNTSCRTDPGWLLGLQRSIVSAAKTEQESNASGRDEQHHCCCLRPQNGAIRPGIVEQHHCSCIHAEKMVPYRDPPKAFIDKKKNILRFSEIASSMIPAAEAQKQHDAGKLSSLIAASIRECLNLKV